MPHRAAAPRSSDTARHDRPARLCARNQWPPATRPTINSVLSNWISVSVTGNLASDQKMMFSFRNGGSHRLLVSDANRATSISTSRQPSEATTTVLADEKASGRIT
ncbi:hypothetical protein D3C87_1886080 [compost metagenome]